MPSRSPVIVSRPRRFADHHEADRGQEHERSCGESQPGGVRHRLTRGHREGHQPAGLRHVGEVEVAEVLGQGERDVTGLLQAGRLHPVRPIEDGVVAGGVADLAEADPCRVGPPHAHAEIRRGTQTEVVERQRDGHVGDGLEGLAQPPAVVGDQGRPAEGECLLLAQAQQRRFDVRIPLAGEREHAGTGDAGRLEGEPEVDVAEPRMVLEEQGVERGGLVRVTEPQHDVVGQRRTGLDGANRLQKRGHSEPAVVGVHRCRQRVEVTQHRHRAGAVSTRDACDDVAQPPGEDLVEVVAGDDPLHDLRFDAELTESLLDRGDSLLVLRRAHRPRRGGHLLELGHGALGREDPVRRGRRPHVGGQDVGQVGQAGGRDRHQQHGDHRNGTAPPHPEPAPRTTRGSRVGRSRRTRSLWADLGGARTRIVGGGTHVRTRLSSSWSSGVLIDGASAGTGPPRRRRSRTRTRATVRIPAMSKPASS